MKVTLAKALKEKSRLAGRLKRNFEILSQENSKISGSIRSFDLKALMAETMQMHAAIIRLKQIIAETNAPIAGRLAEMDEIKSIITQQDRRDRGDSSPLLRRNRHIRRGIPPGGDSAVCRNDAEKRRSHSG